MGSQPVPPTYEDAAFKLETACGRPLRRNEDACPDETCQIRVRECRACGGPEGQFADGAGQGEIGDDWGKRPQRCEGAGGIDKMRNRGLPKMHSGIEGQADFGRLFSKDLAAGSPMANGGSRHDRSV